MAKKIELNKQTLRVLSAEEMETVAGGTDATTTVSGCHTRVDGTSTTLTTTTTDVTSTDEATTTVSGCHTR